MARKPTPAGAAASTPATTTTADNTAGSTDAGATGGEQNSDPASSPTGDTPAPPAGPEETSADAAALPAAPAPANSDASADIGTATADAPDEPIEEVGTIEVRILVDHGDHRPNDVALLTPAELGAALSAGWADNNAEAIAFAKSLVA